MPELVFHACSSGIVALAVGEGDPSQGSVVLDRLKRLDDGRTVGALGFLDCRRKNADCVIRLYGVARVCRKTPFLEFEPASAVKFDPDLTGGFRVKWTWSATFGGKRRAGGDFGAHIGDFRKYRAWRAAGSPVRAALAGFPGDVRQLFVAGT